jgi:hypothetical protein
MGVETGCFLKNTEGYSNRIYRISVNPIAIKYMGILFKNSNFSFKYEKRRVRIVEKRAITEGVRTLNVK